MLSGTKKKLIKKYPLRKLEKIFVISLVVLGVLIGGVIGFVFAAFSDMSAIKKLESYTPPIPTKIFDVKGRLIAEFYTQKRELVNYTDLPQHLINAVIAVEDNNFYEHHGIDIWGILRAAFVNLMAGRVKEGGSTITQQLAKTLFTSGERTIWRKIKELWYSLQIEKKYSKKEILELYFNQIYYGHGLYGVEAAAKFYFGKHAKDLNLAECAFLAGLPQAPNRYSPIRHPILAQKRHWKVLKNMVELGFITRKQAVEAFEDFWVWFNKRIRQIELRSPSEREDKAPYFTDFVKRQLEKLYGSEKLYEGGLRVYTTLDLDKQKIARKYLLEAIKESDRFYRKQVKKMSDIVQSKLLDVVDLLGLMMGNQEMNIGVRKLTMKVRERLNEDIKDQLLLMSYIMGLDDVNRIVSASYEEAVKARKREMVEGAFVAINPHTGYIEVLIGGRKFTYENQLNRAVQSRRPVGSAFKPFIYAAAIDTRRFTAATVINDEPVFFETPTGDIWSPKNYSGKYHGPMRLRKALYLSINVVTVRLLHRLGIPTAREYIGKFFDIEDPEVLKKRFRDSLTMALGVFEATPFELCRAVATFPNGGRRVRPIAILRVEDRFGRLIDDFETRHLYTPDGKPYIGEKIVDEGTAYIISSIMRDVIKHGTGYMAAQKTHFNLNWAAGKTGTSSNWRDAWFMGFTSDLAAVVWIGFDDPQISLGIGRAGGKVSAPVWMKFMKEVYKDKQPPPFHRPPDVVEAPVCEETGLIPNEYCPKVVSEYFLVGTVPVKICDKHSKEWLEKEKKSQEQLREAIEEHYEEKEFNLEEDTNEEEKGHGINFPDEDLNIDIDKFTE